MNEYTNSVSNNLLNNINRYKLIDGHVSDANLINFPLSDNFYVIVFAKIKVFCEAWSKTLFSILFILFDRVRRALQE